MTVCKFFMQGYCKYGSSCRFEHPSGGNAGYAYTAQRQLFGQRGGGGHGGGGGGSGGNRFQQNQYKWQSTDYNQQNRPVTTHMSTNDVINTLISEITDWEKNKMWPFSCVAFEKECPCIPDFTDTSPEELRVAAYEAQQTGNIQSYIQQAQTLAEEYKQKRLQVKNLNMTMKQRLISMIEDYRLRKNKSGSSSSGSVSLFSKSTNSAFGATGSSSSSPFASTGSSNVFGASGTSPLGSSRGNTANAFGASGQTFGVATTPSAFGTQQTFGHSTFGSSTFTSSNQAAGTENKTLGAFSGSAFGTQTGSSPLNFGPQQNQTVTALGQGPSNTPAGFPSAVPQTSFGASPFGNQSQTTGLFGKPQTSPATNLFGSFTTQSPNVSGFPSTGATASGFPSSGATGGGFPSGGATASAASSSHVDAQKYTPLDQLTPEELEAFQAPTFTLGRIPTRPPPKELVF